MSETNVQIFDPGAGGMAQGDAAAVARATQEIQAALVIAQRVGRDEVRVTARILQACQRPELAGVAEYEYSRGGTKITGPTIYLLRAIANRWGNIRYGWEEKARSIAPDGVGMSQVRVFAWDLYTNAQSERTFSVKHWRDTSGGGYKLTDERDIYELMANSAARRVRACLEEVIDADVVDKAVEQCRKTLREGAKGVPLKDRAARMLVEFQVFGVTQDMIERRLGNKMDAVSENQIASLRRIWTSLRDGIGTREDYFKPEPAKPEFDETKPAGSETRGAPAATQPASTATPPATPPTPPPQPPAESPLKTLRALAAGSKVKEGQLLEHWAKTGATDGSATSLEEVAMMSLDLVKATIDNWPDVAARIGE